MRADDSIPDSRFATASAVRVAVARHTGARDGDHLDFFVGPVGDAGPDARVARCWRLPLEAWRAEGLAEGRFAATEIALHRAEYLSIAAPRELSDGRGRIEPLARGRACATVGASRGSTLTVRWTGLRIELAADRAVIAADPEGVVR